LVGTKLDYNLITINGLNCTSFAQDIFKRAGGVVEVGDLFKKQSPLLVWRSIPGGGGIFWQPDEGRAIDDQLVDQINSDQIDILKTFLITSAELSLHHCFAADSLVAVPGGMVRIDSIRVGDTVLAFRTDVNGGRGP
jgi:hypothetical protein